MNDKPYEYCHHCEDCGCLHDNQRVVQIRRMAEIRSAPAHWRLTCNICNRIAINSGPYVYDQNSYREFCKNLRENLLTPPL